MSRLIVLDTETTGIEPSEGHRIIEIGCTEIVDREIIENNEYHQYIQPERLVGDSERIHGIKDSFLAAKRAHQLSSGGHRSTLDVGKDKPSVVALREIEAGLINASILTEVYAMEEELSAKAKYETTNQIDKHFTISAILAFQ
jgi:DNA-directed RNA polymerase subunit K/omega